MNFEERCISMIKEGEGCVPYMYLDAKGYVTVGVGQLLRTVAAAQELDFTRRDTGANATAEETAQDFEAVSAHPGGNYAAAYYEQFTKLDLPEDAIDTLLRHRIEGFEAGLRRDFPDYDSYPDKVRLGLVDMAFNLGNAGLVRKFPNFTRAVREKDWATCASECHRRDISQHRNDATRKLFEDAIRQGA